MRVVGELQHLFEAAGLPGCLQLHPQPPHVHTQVVIDVMESQSTSEESIPPDVIQHVVILVAAVDEYGIIIFH